MQKRVHRVVIHLNDEEAEHLDHAVEVSGIQRADYIRAAIQSTPEGNHEGNQAHVQVLTDALADARQDKDRLQQLLLVSQTSIAGLTRALPAPASNGHRPWWRVW